MKLVILGAGGYGQTVSDIARQSGRYESIAFLDDNDKLDFTVGHCSDFMQFINESTELYPAFGDNESRMRWIIRLQEYGARLPVLIHQSAYVSPTASVRAGTVVLPHAVVNTGCVIGSGCIINCGAIVDHGCVLEDGVHICLGAIVKGENKIGRCVKIEAGKIISLRTYPLQMEGS